MRLSIGEWEDTRSFPLRDDHIFSTGYLPLPIKPTASLLSSSRKNIHSPAFLWYYKNRTPTPLPWFSSPLNPCSIPLRSGTRNVLFSFLETIFGFFKFQLSLLEKTKIDHPHFGPCVSPKPLSPSPFTSLMYSNPLHWRAWGREKWEPRHCSLKKCPHIYLSIYPLCDLGKAYSKKLVFFLLKQKN